VLDPLLHAGEAATCGIVDLEALYSASGPAVYVATAAALGEMPKATVDEECVVRALEIQALLAEHSQHRGASVPDLLVAACAERAGLILLHYDSDYDRIAEVTGQPTRWVVPRGSVS
jgi:predicted nucleic acid-binding protein